MQPTSSPVAVAASSFLEGPAADADGSLYFSDILANRIYRWSAAGRLDVYREDAGRPNGSVLTRAGLLYTCEGGEMGPGGRRRVVRTDITTGVVEVLADSYDGRRLNSPNDLTVGGDGTVYFTDPRYDSYRDDLELDVEGVYRVGTDGTVTRLLDNGFLQRPNGIALSPDERTLYVADSHPQLGGHRLILAVPLHDDGTAGEPRVVFDFGTGRGGDGIKVDIDNRLYIYVPASCTLVRRARPLSTLPASM